MVRKVECKSNGFGWDKTSREELTQGIAGVLLADTVSVDITSASVVELNVLDASLAELVNAFLLQAIANLEARGIGAVQAISVIAGDLTIHHAEGSYKQQSRVKHDDWYG